MVVLHLVWASLSGGQPFLSRSQWFSNHCKFKLSQHVPTQAQISWYLGPKQPGIHQWQKSDEVMKRFERSSRYGASTRP